MLTHLSMVSIMSADVCDMPQAERRDHVREMRCALKAGESLEQRQARREQAIDKWGSWLEKRYNCFDGPLEQFLATSLPSALAEIELTARDEAIAAVAELKVELRDGLVKVFGARR
jgi:hypothetical protein